MTGMIHWTRLLCRVGYLILTTVIVAGAIFGADGAWIGADAAGMHFSDVFALPLASRAHALFSALFILRYLGRSRTQGSSCLGL